MSESTRKVQNVRQLITQIRQKVFQKGAFPAVIIYLERMVTIMKRFYTAESVTEGHPDKLCDLIADSILDACLKEDENSRVACEVLATKRNIIASSCSRRSFSDLKILNFLPIADRESYSPTNESDFAAAHVSPQESPCQTTSSAASLSYYTRKNL